MGGGLFKSSRRPLNKSLPSLFACASSQAILRKSAFAPCAGTLPRTPSVARFLHQLRADYRKHVELRPRVCVEVDVVRPAAVSSAELIG